MMNSNPRPPTITTVSYPPEIQNFITEKRQNFVGRKFVFDAIQNFINRYSRGYFTLVGFPGMGKSAILSQYVFKNPQTIFYTCEINNYHQTEVFLETLFNQLIQAYSLSYSSLPENATADGWFLSVILQQVSDLLSPDERLVIMIDGCDKTYVSLRDRLNNSTQPLGSNLLYLPRYLPDNIYFILSRRPFLSEQSGLLVETPSKILDLSQYYQQNQQDIQAYLNQFNLGNEKIENILNQSKFNFKYAVEIAKKIDNYSLESLPKLIEYYQNHWQRMVTKNPSELQLNIIDCWTEQNEWLSAEAIAEQLDEDEYEIERVLADWIEFLQCDEIESETCYRWYHPSFCQFLKSRELIID
ncbi:MAG: ATP-binding protein [Microcoleaceae cyanobacterium]